MRGIYILVGVCGLLFSSLAHADGGEWLQSYDKKFARRSFAKSVERFLEEFDQKKFETQLEKIIDDIPIKPKQLDRIKEQRLMTQRIRAVYEFFDIRHHVPPDFDYFVVQLGKLKDALSADADARPFARNLHQFLKFRDVSYILEDFQPDNRENVQLYTADRIGKLEKLSKESSLANDDYHKLRKGLRNLYFVLKLLGAEQNVGDEVVLLELKELERQMGLVHDEVEEKMMRSEAHVDRLPVPKEVTSLIQQGRALLLSLPLKRASCRMILN